MCNKAIPSQEYKFRRTRKMNSNRVAKLVPYIRKFLYKHRPHTKSVDTTTPFASQQLNFGYKEFNNYICPLNK